MIGLLLLVATAAAAAPPRVAGDPTASIAPADTATSAAQPAAPDTVLLLPEVRVDRDRVLLPARRRVPTGFASDLSARVPGRALETVADVLAGASGVSVQQYGGLGAFSTVSVRGAPPGQLSVFVDGTPLTSAANGVVDVGGLTSGAIERVEVYRGLFPLGLGPATPGGALNLVTRAAPGPLDLRVVRGSFETWQGAASGGVALGAFTGSLHADYEGSRGNYRYPDDNGTPFNSADDSVSVRRNDRFDAAALHAALGWVPGPGTRVTLRQTLQRRAQGVPGIGAVPALHPRLSSALSLSHLEATREAGRAWPALALRAGLRRERERFRDTAMELGLGRHDSDDRFGAEDLALELGWPHLPLGLSLQGAGSLHRERARLADAADPFADPPPSRRDARGAMAGLRWRSPGGVVLIDAANRWDRIEDRLRTTGVGNLAHANDATRTLDSPQAGARVRLPYGLEARANWADAERAPTFLELFGDQGSVQGNPALRPERGRNWDAGLGWTRRLGGARATAEWARFGSRAEDLVVYARNSQSSVRAINVARATVRGEEWSARLDAPGGASLSGSFTWQSALDEGPVAYWRGRRIPLRPGRQGSAALDLPAGRWRLTTRVDHMGDDYADAYNRRRVPSRTLLGMSISWATRPENWRVTLEGRNLTDRHVFDVGGFPLPGRSVFLACETRLGPAEPIQR